MKKIYIYGYIHPYEISHQYVADQLRNVAKDEPVTVYIHSDGGDVYEGMAIYNELKSRNCTVIITGIAASIASVIALSGKKIQIIKNSFMWIHNPWTIIAGDGREMQKTAGDLETMKQTVIDIYDDRSSLLRDEIIEMMDYETLITAEMALEYGFVDEIIDASDVEMAAVYKIAMQRQPKIFDNKHQETDMNLLKLIAQAMGLKDTASEAEAVAAVTNLVNQKQTLENDLQTERTAHQSVKDELAQIKGDTSTAQAKAKAEADVEIAIAAGKIAPAQKNAMVAMAQASPENFKAFIDAQPKIIDGPAPAAGGDNDPPAHVNAYGKAEADLYSHYKKGAAQ